MLSALWMKPFGNVQQSLKLNEKSANAHSLLADLYGRKISFAWQCCGAQVWSKGSGGKPARSRTRPEQCSAFASPAAVPGNAKILEGDVDKAIGDFRRATQLDPKSDETFVWLAIALRKKGDNEGANEALRQALRLNPRAWFANHAKK